MRFGYLSFISGQHPKSQAEEGWANLREVTGNTWPGMLVREGTNRASPQQSQKGTTVCHTGHHVHNSALKKW